VETAHKTHWILALLSPEQSIPFIRTANDFTSLRTAQCHPSLMINIKVLYHTFALSLLLLQKKLCGFYFILAECGASTHFLSPITRQHLMALGRDSVGIGIIDVWTLQDIEMKLTMRQN